MTAQSDNREKNEQAAKSWKLLSYEIIISEKTLKKNKDKMSFDSSYEATQFAVQTFFC